MTSRSITSCIYVSTEECNTLNAVLNMAIGIKLRRMRFVGNAARMGRWKFSTKF